MTTMTQTTAPVVYRPLVDVLETPEAHVLVVDMPGVDENEAEVTLEKNLLTIRGTVTAPSFPDHTPAHTEYGVGHFERVFTVSNQVDREGIEAEMKDGVLRVTLPKGKEALTKKVTVKGA